MNYEVTLDGNCYQIEIERAPQGFLVAIDGGPKTIVDVRRPQEGVLSVIRGDFSYEAGVVETGAGWDVDVYGVTHCCEVVDPKRRALRLGGGSNEGVVTTAMPGRIVRVFLAQGDRVEKGDPLMIVEAMKMENEIKAPVSGELAEVLVADGDTVDAGAKLVRITPE
ncbi:MAG: biotin/lipoyl-containing protein [Myxococcota bacterium]|nr:biotin/lipoyl-containing protein [Myxococcota bacterium]